MEDSDIMPPPVIDKLHDVLNSTYIESMKDVKTAQECAVRIANEIKKLECLPEEDDVRVFMPRKPFF